jgi:hypothetical protein
LQRIIPFYKFFGKEDERFGTPGGALVLHWIATVVVIAWMPENRAFFVFVLGIFDYGNLIVMCMNMQSSLLCTEANSIDPQFSLASAYFAFESG